MAQVNVNIRLDEHLKTDFEKVCASMGLTMTDAMTVFAKAVTLQRAIPFKVSARAASHEITPASEKALARDWMLPEEDKAWEDL
ncbi:MAG: type II toxin-antitoxin system RelB/DinJ family antitoxin [Burkholderiales bacterium]|jgi:DNA-damage-inducible protein J|nr:type II toxin-antitoxin system RelB/DinJ family antitoxin [Burkholderiales bacterium]